MVAKAKKTNTKSDAVAQDRAFLGRDFLTWLWFRCEAEGGEFDLPAAGGESGSTAVMVEDALALVSVEEDGSVMTLRKGTPTARPEAASALAAGMTLKKARLFVARGPREWQFTLDGETLDLSGVKTPELDEPKEPKPEGDLAEVKDAGEEKAEKKEKVSEEDELEEKLMAAEEARDVVEALYRQFLGVRLGKEWDKSELPRMCEWVGIKIQKAASQVGMG